MPKINVYLPDELAEAVKESGVPVSAICQRALEQAVRRVTAIRETSVGDLDLEQLAVRLPHFTPRAHAVLRLAQERARAENTSTIDTEHLLGGMLAEGSNVALHVLRAVEVDPEQLERDLDQLAAALTKSAATDQPAAAATTSAATEQLAAAAMLAATDQLATRFSGPAANALELTVTEAIALGHNYVGCEHLLLGLLAEPDGTAGQILRARGVEPRLTRRAIAAWLAGYVHLRTQSQPGDPAAGTYPSGTQTAGTQTAGTQTAGTQTAGTQTAGADPAKVIGAVVRQELQPLVQRIERIEALVGVPSDQNGVAPDQNGVAPDQ
ncbi:Clp protease N-terminal domain-containing protein [Micromonospora sp. NPDC003197]